MISIRLKWWKRGTEISAVGHAGYGAHGQDIVCAGVSALLYAYLAYLSESGEHGRVERSEHEGELWVRTMGFAGADKRALEVTRAGLFMIAEAYPQCVSVREEAWSSNGDEKEGRYGRGYEGQGCE